LGYEWAIGSPKDAINDLVKTGQFAGEKENGEGRNRTGDTTIFSRVLYQLSYLAWMAAPSGAQSEG
jgi:hypothetical protein